MLENKFPAIAALAFAEARRRVLSSGQSILESKDGVIYEVFPDGRRVEIKRIEPRIPVVAGTVLTIR